MGEKKKAYHFPHHLRRSRGKKNRAQRRMKTQSRWLEGNLEKVENVLYMKEKRKRQLAARAEREAQLEAEGKKARRPEREETEGSEEGGDSDEEFRSLPREALNTDGQMMDFDLQAAGREKRVVKRKQGTAPKRAVPGKGAKKGSSGKGKGGQKRATKKKKG